MTPLAPNTSVPPRRATPSDRSSEGRPLNVPVISIWVAPDVAAAVNSATLYICVHDVIRKHTVGSLSIFINVGESHSLLSQLSL
ncbi:MAG: hypothetical protein ABSB40_11060 [Nitrososphaeria archaeon]